MIADDAANDGTAQQQPVIAAEGTTVRPGVFLGFVGDDLRCAPAKINNL